MTSYKISYSSDSLEGVYALTGQKKVSGATGYNSSYSDNRVPPAQPSPDDESGSFNQAPPPLPTDLSIESVNVGTNSTPPPEPEAQTINSGEQFKAPPAPAKRVKMAAVKKPKPRRSKKRSS